MGSFFLSYETAYTSIPPYLVYPDLSYKIIGVVLDVYSTLGPGLLEKIYQKATAVKLTTIDLKFIEQLYSPIIFEGKRVGINYFDFLVEEKIVLELKRGNKFSKAHIDQLFNYLVSKDLKLGLLVYFGSQQVHYKRILNIYPK